jgi:hypothetical protein
MGFQKSPSSTTKLLASMPSGIHQNAAKLNSGYITLPNSEEDETILTWHLTKLI